MLGMFRSHWAYAAVEESTCFFTISDVHGYSAALRSLLEEIVISSKNLPPEVKKQIILGGDYMDRGPDSRGVIQVILDFQDRYAEQNFEVISLGGNHDLCAAFALEGLLTQKWQLHRWLHPKVGGAETLKSYMEKTEVTLDDIAQWQDVMREKYPNHIQFIKNLKLHHQNGEYLFTHAGVDPNLPWKQQLTDVSPVSKLVNVVGGSLLDTEMNLTRRPFIPDALPPGAKVVVHGHTTSKEERELGRNVNIVISDGVRPWDLGIDTGVFRGNETRAAGLTCFWRYQNHNGFMWTPPSGGQVIRYQLNLEARILSLTPRPAGPILA